uniref:Helicase C-terminal domain-containing protein n=1 Tax=Odontella aurita TaxID=265563 RepID=A0A7S4JPA2_9STRA
MAATKQFYLAHPKRLAGADIVVTTFDALMADLGHSAENPYVAKPIGTGRGLRKRKRYRVVPSPLTSIDWWRVCLDEAQRIETPTAASARMALQLSARHRWCVSGTPVGRGKLDDLFGLLLFLGARPFGDKRWFQACFSLRHRGAMGRIGHVLSDMLWRSTKSNDVVRRQMGVPEQVEKKVYLQLSSVEKHFYKQQLEKTIEVKNERDAVGGRKATKRRKDKYDGLLSQQIHRLRAACCHPQVGTSGIRRINKRGRKGQRTGSNDDSFSPNARVLSMDQILDRLVTDAKKKCEESQRIAILHTNGLASLGRLKVEAKKFGRPDSQPDAVLLQQSVKSYLDNLHLMDENATPTSALGEATLLGCVGFRPSRKVVRDGHAVLDWQRSNACGRSTETAPAWARFEFEEGFSKRITALSVRCLEKLPGDLEAGPLIAPMWNILKPRNCVLQAGVESLGGSFVDVYGFDLPAGDSEGSAADNWEYFSGFISGKSKSWRIVINSYHNDFSSDPIENIYIGLEVRLMEDEVATDSFQRMHTLHNVSLALSSLMQCDENVCEQQVYIGDQVSGAPTVQDAVDKLETMTEESQKLEKVYMERAVNVHRASQLKLAEAMKERDNCKHDLEVTMHTISHLFNSFGTRSKVHEGDTGIGDTWFEDFLSLMHLRGSTNQRHSLCELVHKDLTDFYETFVEAKELETMRVRSNRFPSFNDVDGLHMAFNLRMHNDEVTFSPCAHLEPVELVSKLSPSPALQEIHENSCCQKCRADWNQTGPVCSHCKLEDELVRSQMQVNDPELMCVLKSMAKWLKGKQAEGSNFDHQLIVALNARASKFFDLHDKTRKVVDNAKLAWRTHFDLLSDLDELKQTKSSSRLPREGEDLSDLSIHEAGFVVQPCDISAQFMDNEARQAMAMADLRRNMSTLRYLKNQKLARKERASAEVQSRSGGGQNGEERGATCVVCLSPFDGDRAVLSCGHYFHESPCLERLIARSGGNSISCPMRCGRTRIEDVFIATNKRKDDGSRSTREVKGCWGTKVDRLVGDIMDVSDLGQKAIVFSQWDDFLSIIEAALEANGVKFVRPKSGGRKFGDAVKAFRSSNCSVIMMNVKNGAEGLTLVEATHVFMVEPLLNCGLDIQAVNRIHRIGQAQKTFVHRYLVQNTVEEKIDRWRMERQNNHFEDDLQEQKKHNIKAGGIDGGFSPSELHDLLN